MGNSSYSDLYGTQAGTHYGFEASQGIQPAFGQRPAYAPQNVQSQNPKDAAPKVWGTGSPLRRPWYLQTWFIILLIASVVGFVPGIILAVMQGNYDDKMFARYKMIEDADTYWAYVKEDCAKIYREATEQSEALIEEGKRKKRITEETANQYLLNVDKECKAKRLALRKEMEDLIAQRDFLQEEIRQIQEGQVTLSSEEE
ncbi:MAG: hypothetical protein IKN55_11540 [Oscillospiraceae bacterium]|nr:hypothetical protein [Oscillospiraceae bacterium]